MKPAIDANYEQFVYRKVAPACRSAVRESNGTVFFETWWPNKKVG